MLLYAQRRWPDAIDKALWPYALHHANNIHNAVPLKDQRLSPLERFCGSYISPQLRNFHHFGCPAYVLNNELQQGKKGKKWQEKARVGIYLGHSMQHARSVALILSLSTGNVSPQFHCHMDDTFDTVVGTEARLMPKSQCQIKTRFKNEDVEVKNEKEIGRSVEQPFLPTTTRDTIEEDVRQNEGEIFPLDEQPLDPAPITPEQHEQPQGEPQPLVNVRRSGRQRRPPTHFQDYVPIEEVVMTTTTLEQDTLEYKQRFWQEQPLLAYKAVRKSDPDTMYLWQAMREPDWPQFKKAMQDEIDTHTKMGHWKIMKRSDLPKGASVLPAVWSMKCKRRIETREVYKWKARITVDGSKQRYKLHYDETYSPVVTWAATRFFLIQSILHSWYTRQLDFLLAYPQADIERELYMEIPKGITTPSGTRTSDYVLKLIKNLYGQKQAGRVWYMHLVKHLLQMGFTQSRFDPCVFYYRKCIVLIYVDDTILLGPTKKEVEHIVRMLHSTFDIQDEGNMSDYLGVKITHNEDGTITLTQPQIINSILQDLRLLQPGATGRSLPALTSKILHADHNGVPFDNSFHYRSLIGKLNFLEKSTRPEIAYAVHQCARFVEAPTKLHGEAVKHIGRYLLKTRDKGIILRPNKSSFDCWVDASHAGEWRKHGAESENDATTAKSRTGYVLLYAGCPLIWASKLQTEVALSSTEAEYIALSQAMREVIPLMNLMKEAQEQELPINIFQAHIHCKIFENNSGALEMARAPRMRPRTKHINIKYHHFWNTLHPDYYHYMPYLQNSRSWTFLQNLFQMYYSTIIAKPYQDGNNNSKRRSVMIL
jgi:hypothetical protein